MHVRNSIDAKQERIEDRERDGDQTQPERHRGDDGQGDERRAGAEAQGIKNVPDRVLDEIAHTARGLDLRNRRR